MYNHNKKVTKQESDLCCFENHTRIKRTCTHLMSLPQDKGTFIKSRHQQHVICIQISKQQTERVFVPVPHTFPFPFGIRSISVLYLFCSRSASVPSVSILGTHSEERGFRELVYKNASNQEHSVKTFALCVCARIQTKKLHFLGENVSPVT